jgi:hypothetical protein
MIPSISCNHHTSTSSRTEIDTMMSNVPAKDQEEAEDGGQHREAVSEMNERNDPGAIDSRRRMV